MEFSRYAAAADDRQALITLMRSSSGRDEGTKEQICSFMGFYNRKHNTESVRHEAKKKGTTAIA